MHLSKNKAISVGKGVAIQDEGGNTPLVQVSVAERDDSLGTKMSDLDTFCNSLLMVNNESFWKGLAMISSQSLLTMVM